MTDFERLVIARKYVDVLKKQILFLNDELARRTNEHNEFKSSIKKKYISKASLSKKMQKMNQRESYLRKQLKKYTDNITPKG